MCFIDSCWISYFASLTVIFYIFGNKCSFWCSIVDINHVSWELLGCGIKWTNVEFDFGQRWKQRQTAGRQLLKKLRSKQHQWTNGWDWLSSICNARTSVSRGICISSMKQNERDIGNVFRILNFSRNAWNWCWQVKPRTLRRQITVNEYLIRKYGENAD